MKYKQLKYPFAIKYNDLDVINIGYIKTVCDDINENGFAMYIEDTLKKYGWSFIEDTDTGAVWSKTFNVGVYDTEINAMIAYKPEHLDGCGLYGLMWIECDYEYSNRPLCFNDLKDIKECSLIAIEQLLAKGIPFHLHSDIFKHKEEYGLTYLHIKRNIDLLNATRLLEFNYVCEKEKIEESMPILEWWEKYVEDRERYRSYDWMRSFIEQEKNEVKENG